MSTPEGKVKIAVKKMLHEFDDMPTKAYTENVGRHPKLYQFWPVQNGMGSPSLDCLVCYYGVFLTIETKAPGKAPTPRQELTIAKMVGAGATVFVVDGPDGIEHVRRALTMIKFSNGN